MLKFEWHDKVPVDYGDGIVFYLEDNLELFDQRLIAASKKLDAAVKKYHGKDKKSELNAYLDAIDDLLGEGATEKLFENHALTETNIVAAYLFIPDSFRAFQEEAAAKVTAVGNRVFGKPDNKISAEAQAKAKDALDNMKRNPPTKASIAIAEAQTKKARL